MELWSSVPFSTCCSWVRWQAQYFWLQKCRKGIQSERNEKVKAMRKWISESNEFHFWLRKATVQWDLPLTRALVCLIFLEIAPVALCRDRAMLEMFKRDKEGERERDNVEMWTIGEWEYIVCSIYMCPAHISDKDLRLESFSQSCIQIFYRATLHSDLVRGPCHRDDVERERCCTECARVHFLAWKPFDEFLCRGIVTRSLNKCGACGYLHSAMLYRDPVKRSFYIDLLQQCTVRIKLG